ncbi:oligosaccharide flippase family protein [Pseudoprimorskyibacter insulae]|uniref:Teichuronic acid biosynthesis protein TuaB n=1 Tax=Pseudoprimorskyibacter insulae TaxID=1695997 RepID=A0A2R8ATW1_9RHOB|nr:oligosaccharide flippase family protein [Pseudoprimorskyibacter insulae]SPF79483.1 Teichuronic acid biosynthesis protein TuaB [Pseudoprimorskyibacter insulae]
MNAVLAKFRGGSLSARALRSAFVTVGGFGSSQALRLASNLILTRLLFPEAFGLMAMVTTIVVGLSMFSDVGVTPAILQSKRGDDPRFLNTAWTIQAMRGFGLWLAACAAAWPLAWFYDEPQLAQVLPAASFALVIAGFNPTRMDTANRNLLLGRLTALEITAQVIGLIVAVTLAWITGSLWSLVVSGLVSAVALLALTTLYLPGVHNRFDWEKPAAQELISFGKWIFLSTACGFVVNQADKIIFGKYLPLDQFGVYNIGYFLASFPLMLGFMVTRKVLIPIYRETPPEESRANYDKLCRMRRYVTGLLMVLLASFACLGGWLVDLMYDDRYAAAGGVAVLMACMHLPQIVVMTYDQAALAAGDSKRFFALALTRATLMVVALIVGLETAGLIGGIVAQGAAMVLAYPVVVWLARRMSVWDAAHDALFMAIGLSVSALALWINWDVVASLGLAVP